ncbi:hypothetical protein EJ07DRAFT_156717 [Lizonia empirigonia]|nr:hypothetical protein EJ07DRAFT_156717 [Lizonia empirigonia]
MASPQQPQLLAQAKARRAANNNYRKVSKTLFDKLSKLCQEYDTDVYFIAHRNGRFNGFVSRDSTGQLWLPPAQDTLDRWYPPPVIKSPSPSHRAGRRRGQTISPEPGSRGPCDLSTLAYPDSMAARSEPLEEEDSEGTSGDPGVGEALGLTYTSKNSVRLRKRQDSASYPGYPALIQAILELGDHGKYDSKVVEPPNYERAEAPTNNQHALL